MELGVIIPYTSTSATRGAYYQDQSEDTFGFRLVKDTTPDDLVKSN